MWAISGLAKSIIKTIISYTALLFKVIQENNSDYKDFLTQLSLTSVCFQFWDEAHDSCMLAHYGAASK